MVRGEGAGVLNEDLIIAQLREEFAEVPRPGLPPGYVPDGKLGNPGWDEFTYHSALVFAEQLPDHVRRAFDSPDKQIPDLLWHLSDSDRLGVFSNRQVALLLRVLDALDANFGEAVRRAGLEARMLTIRGNLERLLARPE
jgi:hypothetical protein